MHEDRFEADYLIETPGNPERVAQIIAGEQSSGTFVPVPGETPELKERSAARVTRLEILDTAVKGRALPSTTPQQEGERVTQARLTLSWPLANIGPSLPNLVATIAGNLYELRDVTGLRLLDIRLPPAFSKAYAGPRFGVEGTRRLSGVYDRPLIGTIIKPSIGLSAEATAALVGDLCEAGIDFIKDDELQSDGPSCPFEERVRAVMHVINENAERTGKKVMYAFNLTGEIDQMRRRHDLVLENGGTCVMASINSVGLAGMIALGRFSQLPVHAHRNGWGYLTRHPLLGWSYVAWQKLWRLAGADHMHVNGLQNKFSEDDASVIASARACLTPMFHDKPCTVMPVFSSGQTVRQAPGTYAGLQSTDLIVTAGGGIVAHPDGPGAGVRAMREAWDATVAGIAIDEHAKAHPALSRALEMSR